MIRVDLWAVGHQVLREVQPPRHQQRLPPPPRLVVRAQRSWRVGTIGDSRPVVTSSARRLRRRGLAIDQIKLIGPIAHSRPVASSARRAAVARPTARGPPDPPRLPAAAELSDGCVPRRYSRQPWRRRGRGRLCTRRGRRRKGKARARTQPVRGRERRGSHRREEEAR